MISISCGILKHTHTHTQKQPKCIDDNEEEIGGCQRQGSRGVGEGSQEIKTSRSFIL